MKITFCHNVYNRFNVLKHTIELEEQNFPSSTFVVSCNCDDGIITDQIDRVNYIYYGPNQGHKVGSYNGLLYSLKKANEFDSDIIVFSHDDIYLNDVELFKSK